jgi:hypothetical protein
MAKTMAAESETVRLTLTPNCFDKRTSTKTNASGRAPLHVDRLNNNVTIAAKTALRRVPNARLM